MKNIIENLFLEISPIANSDYPHNTERSLKTYRGRNQAGGNQPIMQINYSDRLQIHCQKIGYQLMNLGGQHRTDINFSKHKNLKFLKKVKLKCTKKSKRPYYRHHGAQKDFTRSIMHRAVNQLSAGKLSNRRSYISSSARKLKGIDISRFY